MAVIDIRMVTEAVRGLVAGIVLQPEAPAAFVDPLLMADFSYQELTALGWQLIPVLFLDALHYF